jgi:hypothetical protein
MAQEFNIQALNADVRFLSHVGFVADKMALGEIFL